MDVVVVASRDLCSNHDSFILVTVTCSTHYHESEGVHACMHIIAVSKQPNES